MSMFVKLSNRVINLAHVAWAERGAHEEVYVHYSIPHAVKDSSGRAIATDHFQETIDPGADANTIWQRLQSL